MQLDRISYQYPDGTTAAYDLHRRLTVIDVHPAHRRALVEHLLAALSSEAPGVHVEFTRHDNQSLVAFRPYGAAHRVIDLDDGQDVTDRYRVGADNVDVLAPLGLEQAQIRPTLLADGSELAQIDPTEGWMTRLLAHDAAQLLAVAREAVSSERALREATAGVRSTPEAVAAVSDAYLNREVTTALEQRHLRIRLATLFIGIPVPVSAVISLNTIGWVPAVGVILGCGALAGGCLIYERKLDLAVEAEHRALRAAGTGSYQELDAQLEDSPLADAERRQQLIEAAQRYREHTAAWQGLAGDIPAPWVLAQQGRLLEMAGLQAALQPVPLPETNDATASSAAILAGLIARASAIRELGEGEALPLFLDDPLAGLAWVEKVPVLEFLNRLAEHQQMVLCTDDLEILGWARLEAIAANAAVVDVNPGRSLTTVDSVRGN